MRPLRWGMIGGGEGAFIGAVHRMAARLDGRYQLLAGVFSSDAEKTKRSAVALGVDPARAYPSVDAMIAAEKNRLDGVEVISIVTPNHVHYEVARAFVDAGFHVVCDKPLVHTSAQADDLAARVAAQGTLFAVTYNYTGYPMVRQAREMVKSGAIGAVRKVIVEYHQGWLATQLEATANKQAGWRTDPSKSGIAGAIGDIGSHAENLAATVTGLAIESLCADLTAFVPGRRLDDDASLLLRFTNGARGVLLASQVVVGHENDLRLRVLGERGTLDWRQEEPNQLVHSALDAPRTILTRNSPWLSEPARRACRLPPGHPEAFIEAFANLYAGVAADLRARLAGGAPASQQEADYPRIGDGVRGVRFIEKTVESAASAQKWTAMG